MPPRCNCLADETLPRETLSILPFHELHGCKSVPVRREASQSIWSVEPRLAEHASFDVGELHIW